jgi:hypothetical protein
MKGDFQMSEMVQTCIYCRIRPVMKLWEGKQDATFCSICYEHTMYMGPDWEKELADSVCVTVKESVKNVSIEWDVHCPEFERYKEGGQPRWDGRPFSIKRRLVLSDSGRQKRSKGYGKRNTSTPCGDGSLEQGMVTLVNDVGVQVTIPTTSLARRILERDGFWKMELPCVGPVTNTTPTETTNPSGTLSWDI